MAKIIVMRSVTMPLWRRAVRCHPARMIEWRSRSMPPGEDDRMAKIYRNAERYDAPLAKSRSMPPGEGEGAERSEADEVS